jgi:signal peptidase II
MNRWLGLSVVSLVILTDQLVKQFFWWYKPSGLSINKGLSFSLFDGWSWSTIVLSVLILIILRWPRSLSLGLALMIGGGASNLIDRIVRGGVTDYLNLHLTITNLADLSVVVGAGILIGESLTKNDNHK